MNTEQGIKSLCESVTPDTRANSLPPTHALSSPFLAQTKRIDRPMGEMKCSSSLSARPWSVHTLVFVRQIHRNV